MQMELKQTKLKNICKCMAASADNIPKIVSKDRSHYEGKTDQH